jgi:hypothetical protein
MNHTSRRGIGTRKYALTVEEAIRLRMLHTVYHINYVCLGKRFGVSSTCARNYCMEPKRGKAV